jgi:DNA-binding NtrC family response regulator
MLGNSQVMFVDDEEGVRTSWQRFLQDRGVATTTAPDGASAIDQLSRHPVDVVVSDLRMPGKDGLELLEWLHERQPDTRFIMLTGYGDTRLEWRVRDLGAVDYLEKPVSPDVLAHAVERALDPDRVPMMIPTEVLKGRSGLQTPLPAEAAEQATVVAGVVEETTSVAEPSLVKTLGMVVAAPFLGLAFVVFLPVIGIGALGWVLAREIKSSFWGARA